MGYSPWGRKELGMTEHAHVHTLCPVEKGAEPHRDMHTRMQTHTKCALWELALNPHTPFCCPRVQVRTAYPGVHRLGDSSRLLSAGSVRKGWGMGTLDES